MKILFLTMFSGMNDIDSKGIYTDLMRKFRDEKHEVYVVYPNERRNGLPTLLSENNGIHCLGVRTFNVTKANVIEKGIGQLVIGWQFKSALKKFFGKVHFDVIMYSTPPITFNNVIRYVKKISGEKGLTYLMLKDIFPQNAVDMGMLKKTGMRSFLYRLFRNQEKTLYSISDYIGCMSPANVRYILEHNPEVEERKVEICPNCIELQHEELDNENKKYLDKRIVLEKYDIPTNKPIFVYGGNLGVPQGIPFLIECLDVNADREDCHFIVVGTGTHYQKLADWYNARDPKSVTVLNGLPKEEYDRLARVCDVGLIFLDYRFTIPNFPSRILSYLKYKMPVICVTDPNSDSGSIAEANGFGYYAPSNDVKAVTAAVNRMLASDIAVMGENGYKFLKENYLVDKAYNQIMKHK